jgi:excisionase family DNA binding protein
VTGRPGPPAAAETLVYSVEQAASALGIGRSLAFELVSRGELPTVRLGRRRVIPRHLLLDWLDSRFRASMDPAPEPEEVDRA